VNFEVAPVDGIFVVVTKPELELRSGVTLAAVVAVAGAITATVYSPSISFMTVAEDAGMPQEKGMDTTQVAELPLRVCVV